MFVRSSSGNDPPLSFENHRVLLPCISVGNVGQLTADLIINTLHLPRVGYLNHPAILPLVGNDAFDHIQPAGYLHTAAEVYHSAELKLLAVQLRTPLIKGLRGSFCVKLLEWVKEVGISEVVVLTSSHAHERRDSQIRGEQFRFLLSPPASGLHAHFTEQLKWTSLEPRSSQSSEDQNTEPLVFSSTPSPSSSSDSHPHQPGVLSESQVFLPGAGLAKKLYKESGLLGISLVLIVGFCVQGDNIQDAVSMAGWLDSWIHISKENHAGSGERWSFPRSWSMMYGRPSPSTLF